MNDEYFYLGLHLITTLKKVYHSKYPIEVFLIDDGELKKEYKDLLLGFENVSIKVLSHYIGNWDDAKIDGWALKPFAILYSSFEEVMLLDADVVFFENPDVLFENPNYLRTGSFMFRDRTIDGLDGNKIMMNNMLPSISERVRLSRFYNEKTLHEIESGVILLDKSKFDHSLLLTCRLNCYWERLIMKGKFYGDKETYWLAMEMLRMVYSVSPYNIGMLGFLKNDSVGERVCGRNLLHLNDGRLFWINGGLLANKAVSKSDFQKLEYWNIEGKHHWKDEYDCILNNNIQKVSGELFERLTELTQLYREIIEKYIPTT